MNCPLCSSNSNFVYMKGIFDSENTEVIECNNCGLQFLVPLMTSNEEEEYYINYYNNQETRHYKDFNLKDIQNNSLKHYEQYHDLYYDLIRDRQDILEIGSGSGGFIRFIKNNIPGKKITPIKGALFLGTKITAIERSEANLKFLRGHENEDLADVSIKEKIDDIKDKKFDLIVAFGLLEHVRNSENLLNSLKSLLKDENSRIVFNIPNKRNPLVEFYEIEEFKKFAYMKQHYYTFTEKSLKILAKKTGCKIDRLNYIQVWGLDNHLSWLKNKKPHDFSKYTNTFSKETLQSYNNDLIRQKMTDLMMVIFKL